MKLHLGLGAVFATSCALLALSACSDDTGTGTSSNTSTSSSTSASSSGESSSSSSGNTSSSSSGSSGSNSSSSSSSGGGPYTTCSECTNDVTGAYSKECKADWDKCKADTACAALAKCSYDNCSTNAEGGCCTLKCATDMNTPMASQMLFYAVDKCVFCTTCLNLCESDPVSAKGYCAVINGTMACP